MHGASLIDAKGALTSGPDLQGHSGGNEIEIIGTDGECRERVSGFCARGQNGIDQASRGCRGGAGDSGL